MKHHENNDKNWFIVASVAFIFGIVWALVGDEASKVFYAAGSFAFFLYTGISMELNAIASHKAHH
jgi:hypothetical protein